MKNKMNKWINGIVVAGIITLAAASCTNPGGQSNNQAAQPGKDTVYIAGMKFKPAELWINQWDTVVWINNDIVAHDVTEFPDKTWSSDSIQPGQSWEKDFGDSVDYFCSIHPTMHGKIMIRK